MSTISVPLTVDQEEHVKRMVCRGFAATKAAVVRRAVARLIDKEAINAVFQSEQEVREGKVVKGSLRKILKNMS